MTDPSAPRVQRAEGHAHSLARLSNRLRDDGAVQFYLGMRDKFPNDHMKDLVAEDLDGQRGIRLGSHTVVNFGSDSFLGLDQDSRVQEALVHGLKKWGTHNGSSRAFCSVEANVEAEKRLAN